MSLAEADKDRSLAVRVAVVMLLGSVSSAAALGLVAYASSQGTALMYWYEAYILPVGPPLIGLLASVGYAAGARLAGVRFTGAVFALTASAMLGSYLLAEYVEYLVRYPGGVVDDEGRLLHFWSYLDATTRLIHLKSSSPLGWLGYGYRLMGLGGFLGGGLVGAFVALEGRAHCSTCNRYHRAMVVAHLPEGDAATLESLLQLLREPRQLVARLTAVAPRERWLQTSQLDARLLFRFSHCSSCDRGLLVWEKLIGLPDQDSGREVGRHPYEPELSRSFRAAWNELSPRPG